MTRTTIKCVVIGDEDTGKTSMIISFTDGNNPRDYIPTGFDHISFPIEVDGRKIILSLWDTAGQKRYISLRKLLYPNTNIFIICFSLMNVKSFRNVELKWYPEVKKCCPSAKIILIGTKIYMSNNEEASAAKDDFKKISNEKPSITYSEGIEMAEKICAFKYLEYSCLTSRVNLEEVFKAIVRSSSLFLPTIAEEKS